MSKTVKYAGISLLLASVSSHFALAAESSVYAPLGIRAGGFTIKPSIESHNEWNDNIYATETNEVDDFIFHVKPALDISSNWNNHLLKLNVGGDFAFYASNGSEDKQDYYVNLLGRLDVVRNSFGTAEFFYKHQTEDRGSPDSPSASTQPVEFDVLGGRVGYEHKINRVRVNVGHEFKHFAFEDTQSASGTTLNNSERNRFENRSELRVGYEMFSGYEAYIAGGYNFIDYENLFAGQGNRDRSSEGYEVSAGLAMEITNVLLADAHIGYQEQFYDFGGSISGVTGGVRLEWAPTRLTTVTLNVDRDIQETALTNASGTFSTAAMLSIEHQLKRNILIKLYGGYTNNEYKGGLDRNEDLFKAGVGVKYLISRNFYLTAGYDYRTRDTNISNTDYDINKVYMNIGLQL